MSEKGFAIDMKGHKVSFFCKFEVISSPGSHQRQTEMKLASQIWPKFI